jgi:hypothetical protein
VARATFASMNKEELVNLIKEHMRWFANDKEQLANNPELQYDLAYADGAYNAYEFMLNQLQKDEEKSDA